MPSGRKHWIGKKNPRLKRSVSKYFFSLQGGGLILLAPLLLKKLQGLELIAARIQLQELQEQTLETASLVKAEVERGAKLTKLNKLLRAQQEAKRAKLMRSASEIEESQAKQLNQQAETVAALEEELADLKMHLKVAVFCFSNSTFALVLLKLI